MYNPEVESNIPAVDEVVWLDFRAVALEEVLYTKKKANISILKQQKFELNFFVSIRKSKRRGKHHNEPYQQH